MVEIEHREQKESGIRRTYLIGDGFIEFAPGRRIGTEIKDNSFMYDTIHK